MSLKNFHLLFITAAVLLALLCGAVALDRFRSAGTAVAALAGIGSLAAAGLLIRYEATFLRRCREHGIR
jgi:hypothetical protein